MCLTFCRLVILWTWISRSLLFCLPTLWYQKTCLDKFYYANVTANSYVWIRNVWCIHVFVISFTHHYTSCKYLSPPALLCILLPHHHPDHCMICTSTWFKPPFALHIYSSFSASSPSPHTATFRHHSLQRNSLLHQHVSKHTSTISITSTHFSSLLKYLHNALSHLERTLTSKKLSYESCFPFTG